MFKHFKEKYKHKQHIHLKQKGKVTWNRRKSKWFHYKTAGRVWNGQLTKPLAEMVFYIPITNYFHDKLKGSHASF